MQKSINVFANEAQKAISVERYDSQPFIAPLKVGSSGASRMASPAMRRRRRSFSETDRISAEKAAALLATAAALEWSDMKDFYLLAIFFSSPGSHTSSTSVYYVCMPLNEIRNIYDHLNGSKMARAMTIVIVMTAILGGCVQTYTLILNQRFYFGNSIRNMIKGYI